MTPARTSNDTKQEEQARIFKKAPMACQLGSISLKAKAAATASKFDESTTIAVTEVSSTPSSSSSFVLIFFCNLLFKMIAAVAIWLGAEQDRAASRAFGFLAGGLREAAWALAGSGSARGLRAYTIHTLVTLVCAAWSGKMQMAAIVSLTLYRPCHFAKTFILSA